MKQAAAWLLALAASAPHAACTREFNVGFSEAGFGAYMQDGQWQGTIPDLIAELARRSGCRITLNPRPRARVLLEFEQGQLDIITSSMQAPERDRIGHFLPYGYAELDLVFLGDSPPRNLDEFRKRPELRLGTVRGVRLGHLKEAVDAMLASRQAEYSADFDNLAVKLTAGRLQAVILPSGVHAKMRRDGQLPAKAVAIDLPEGPPEVIGLYLNRANVPLPDVQLLRKHLDAMRREGWVQADYARHVGEAEAKRLFRTEAR